MDLQDSFLKVFEGEDDVGVVIRSHIIIEQQLNILLSKLVVSEKHLLQMRLGYSETVKLAISLGLNSKFDIPLTTLGTLRNKFAHELRPSISKADVNNLYNSLEGAEKATLNSLVKEVGLEMEAPIAHKKLSPKQQYVNIVILLATALQKGISEATNET
ncbi:hypothetical protein [uncultured Paraglaciecola sp.]|uniref:hypothetical protein n=1 Tax=uncultured Paraglaciecola sp. TaxID=1765024 RepID=UPI00260372F3|nr:hypothetical protein [uncultured Paraglaciecola sp.]